VISFFSAFYDENNKLKFNFKDIFINYITGWFWIDSISIIPFEYLISNSKGSNMNLIRY